ncbi:MAG: AAA family ATPase, partial [Gemmatimonadetes bacterium]|nr:AAA family ATPase [Gemmatimonadota bacterium]
MYHNFFGFQRPPFELVPDPDFLFLGESHDAALANVAMGLEAGKGFVVITGPVGAGKTTILRAMLRRLGRDQNVCFLTQPEADVRDLLRAVLEGFGKDADGLELVALRRALKDTLAETDKPGILIVDEAHLLAEESMEQLRLLSNLEEDSRKLLQIVLSGQRELKELLARPRLRPLAQRIELFYEIHALNAEETAAYIDRRIRIAGNPDGLKFEPGSLDAIHAVTAGIPRLINILADRTLITAYVADSRTITEGMVVEAYEDLGEVTQSVMPGEPRRGRRARPEPKPKRRRKRKPAADQPRPEPAATVATPAPTAAAEPAPVEPAAPAEKYEPYDPASAYPPPPPLPPRE